jgi:hypothetical protein
MAAYNPWRFLELETGVSIKDVRRSQATILNKYRLMGDN